MIAAHMTNIKTERAKTVTTPNLGVFDSHNVPGNPTSGAADYWILYYYTITAG